MRVGVALLALVALTAFAPAPFPKTRRGEDGAMSLARFQGKWRVVTFAIVDGNRKPVDSDWFIKHIRVEEHRWTFIDGQGQENSSRYALVIDGSRRPATIDFYSGTEVQKGGQTTLVGLIERQGNVVKLLYRTGTPADRPKSIEDPPEGWWLLTLEKVN